MYASWESSCEVFTSLFRLWIFPILFDFYLSHVQGSLDFFSTPNHHLNITSTFNSLTLEYDTWHLRQAISNIDVRAAGIMTRI